MIRRYSSSSTEPTKPGAARATETSCLYLTDDVAPRAVPRPHGVSQLGAELVLDAQFMPSSLF